MCVYTGMDVFFSTMNLYIYIYDVRHSHSPFSLDNENERRTLKEAPRRGMMSSRGGAY